ncbi:MAG: glycosyltransferase family 4 protein [Armatimonadia bacterium]
MPNTDAPHILQLFSSDSGFAFQDMLALTRHCRRQDRPTLVVGPLNRVQQEQVALAGARWVNLALPACPEPRRPALFAKPPEPVVQLRRLMADFEADLVHCHGVPALSIAAQALPPRAPLVASLGDLSGRQPTRALRQLLRRPQALVVTAESERAALQGIDPRFDGSACLIYSAADPRGISSDFDLGRKRRSLGVRSETAVIGALSPAVRGLGLETVIEAAATITRDFPNVEFLFVGDGADQERLAMKAHELGISGATVFRGDRVDIPEIIASLNVLVIPRETPGAIAHALQALTLQIPVVSVRTPALCDVLEPVDPQAFVPCDDAVALARALAVRLEILPPPNQEGYAEYGLNLNLRDMLVSTAGFDLDQVGLEAQWRGDESQMQQAITKAQARYSSRAMADAIEEIYQSLV